MGQGNLMLVAVMNNKRDLHIARTQHWYRIPVRSAPRKLEEMSYIAFYQTKAFGGEKSSINYWAEKSNVSVVKRRELLPYEDDHPRANDQYYKVEMGDLKRLSKPIVSKRGRRITFIPTTMEKFRAAEEINDLFHDSPGEDKLWNELKKDEIDAERQYHVAEERGQYRLDFAIFCEDGQIDVECDCDISHSQPHDVVKDGDRNSFLASRGWSVLRFSSEDIDKNMAGCLDRIKETAENLGGISTMDGEPRRFEEDDPDGAHQLNLSTGDS